MRSLRPQSEQALLKSRHVSCSRRARARERGGSCVKNCACAVLESSGCYYILVYSSHCSLLFTASVKLTSLGVLHYALLPRSQSCHLAVIGHRTSCWRLARSRFRSRYNLPGPAPGAGRARAKRGPSASRRSVQSGQGPRRVHFPNSCDGMCVPLGLAS